MSDAPLPDGVYDALVIDANDEGEVRHLDLTIVSGGHKGEVISVATEITDRADFDLLGLPATLTVAAGDPSIAVE